MEQADGSIFHLEQGFEPVGFDKFAGSQFGRPSAGRAVARLSARECLECLPGEKGHLTDTAILSGMIQVRMKGHVATYWTAIEATEPK